MDLYDRGHHRLAPWTYSQSGNTIGWHHGPIASRRTPQAWISMAGDTIGCYHGPIARWSQDRLAAWTYSQPGHTIGWHHGPIASWSQDRLAARTTRPEECSEAHCKAKAKSRERGFFVHTVGEHKTRQDCINI